MFICNYVISVNTSGEWVWRTIGNDGNDDGDDEGGDTDNDNDGNNGEGGDKIQ